MGEGTKIEWADHTHNAWWGCVKHSPGCENCYAEEWDGRWGNDHWGPRAPRRFFGEKHHGEPLKWDRRARQAGVIETVFSGSMCDVGEDREDLIPHRARLCQTIMETPNLQWMLLSKRPENMTRLFPAEVLARCWVGTSTENQKYADERIPELLKIKARLWFISAEPLLGPIKLDTFAWCRGCGACEIEEAIGGRAGNHNHDRPGLDWVIAGGESGNKARPAEGDWFRQLRDDCTTSGVKFFFKQWGEFLPHEHRDTGDLVPLRVGKKEAGRELDGRLWNQKPELVAHAL